MSIELETRIDQLIRQNAALAAENERLQSVIDEANAQEPIYQVYLNIEFRWTDCSKEQYERSLEDQSAAVRKLYALPIPAQKSAYFLTEYIAPAESVDPKNFGAIPDSQQSPAVAVPEPRKCCDNPVMDNGYVCCGDYLYGDDATDPPPRITEQDAREILESFSKWDNSEYLGAAHDNWMIDCGRKLLNKLNGDKND